MVIVELLRGLFYEIGVDSEESFFDHLGVLLLIMFRAIFVDWAGSLSNQKRLVSWVHFESADLSPDESFVAIVPVGDVKPSDLSIVYRSARAAFGSEVRLLRRRSLEPSFYDKEKGVVDGDRLLEKLVYSREFPGASRVLAVTDKKIVTSISKNNVYGLAYTTMPVGVVTTILSDLGEFANMTSLMVVTLHELGHTYGLDHCETDSCVMQASPKMVSAEIHFCKNCERKIKGKAE